MKPLAKRIPELDGIRGLAILLVLVWHYIPCQIDMAPTPAWRSWSNYLSLTWSGVDLFFVLSGFLIGGILLDNSKATNYFQVFYARRMLRIFPLYYLLFFSYLLFIILPVGSSRAFSWLVHDPMPLWSYATFCQNYFMGLRNTFGCHWLGITWSLAVEEQFYLLLPPLIWLLPRRMLALLSVCAIAAAPVLRYHFPGFHQSAYTPLRCDSLMTGVLLALAVRNPNVLDGLHRNKGSIVLLTAASLACVVWMTVEKAQYGFLTNSVLAGFFAGLLILVVIGPSSTLAAVFRLPALVWLGTVSYGIYIYHQLVSGLVHGFLAGGPPTLNSIPSLGRTVLALGLTLLLSAVSYYGFEKKLIGFGHRYRYTHAVESKTENVDNVTCSSPLAPLSAGDGIGR